MHANANDDSANLDLSPDEMRRMGGQVLERAIGRLAGLGSAPSGGDYEGIEAVCRSLREPAPEAGVLQLCPERSSSGAIPVSTGSSMNVLPAIRFAALIAIVFAALAAPRADAAVFCVTSGNELNSAFRTADRNDQDDEIRIVQGTHTSNILAHPQLSV